MKVVYSFLKEFLFRVTWVDKRIDKESQVLKNLAHSFKLEELLESEINF